MGYVVVDLLVWRAGKLRREDVDTAAAVAVTLNKHLSDSVNIWRPV